MIFVGGNPAAGTNRKDQTMFNKDFEKEFGAVISRVATGERSLNKATSEGLDVLQSRQVSSVWLRKPEKDASEQQTEFYKGFKAMIRAHAFTAPERALLDMPTTSVPEGKKEARKYLQQQIGSKCAYWARALKKREDADNDDGIKLGRLDRFMIRLANSEKECEAIMGKKDAAAWKAARGHFAALIDLCTNPTLLDD